MRNYLVDRLGVAEERLVSRGFGKRRLFRPEAPNDPENRRVELVLIAGPARGVGRRLPDGRDDGFDEERPVADLDRDRFDRPGYGDGYPDDLGFADGSDDVGPYGSARGRGYGYDDDYLRRLARRRRRFMKSYPPADLGDAWHTGPSLTRRGGPTASAAATDGIPPPARTLSLGACRTTCGRPLGAWSPRCCWQAHDKQLTRKIDASWPLSTAR